MVTGLHPVDAIICCMPSSAAGIDFGPVIADDRDSVKLPCQPCSLGLIQSGGPARNQRFGERAARVRNRRERPERA